MLQVSLCALLSFATVQDAEPKPAYEPQVFELADDHQSYKTGEVAYPNIDFPYEMPGDGRLYFWATSDDVPLSLRLMIGERNEMRDQVPDGPPPMLVLDVERGELVHAVVISMAAERGGEVTMSYRRARDTDVTRAAAEALVALRERVLADETLAVEEASREARAILAEADRDPDVGLSHSLFEAAWDLAFRADQRLDPELRVELWKRCMTFQEEFAAPGWHDRLMTRENLAVTLLAQRRYDEALPHFERLLELHATFSLPEDRLDWLRYGCAETLLNLGQLPRVIAMLEPLCATKFESDAPSTLQDLQIAGVLFDALRWSGNADRAWRLGERVVARSEPEWLATDNRVQRVHSFVASFLAEAGRLQESKAMLEHLLEAMECGPSPNDRNLAAVRGVLANHMTDFGDGQLARYLRERVLASMLAALPEDSDDVQSSRMNLANSLHDVGEFPRALRLKEQAIAAWSTYGETRARKVLICRGSRASTLRAMGRLEEARAEMEHVISELSAQVPEDAPDLLILRENFSLVLQGLGLHERALEQRQLAMDRRRATVPEGDPTRIQNVASLGWANALAGRSDAADAEFREVSRELQLALAQSLDSYSPRELEVFVRQLRGPFASVLSRDLLDHARTELEISERLRCVRLAAARRLRGESEDRVERELLADVQRNAERVRRLAAEASPEWPEAQRALDVAKRRLTERRAALGTLEAIPPFWTSELQAALDDGEVAVAFWVHAETTIEPEPFARLETNPHFKAFVVGRDSLVRVDLGDARAVALLLQDWRERILERASNDEIRAAGRAPARDPRAHPRTPGSRERGAAPGPAQGTAAARALVGGCLRQGASWSRDLTGRTVLPRAGEVGARRA